MEKSKVLEIVKAKKVGAYLSMEAKTNVKTLAAHKNESVTKQFRAVIRVGIEYGNMKVNADREINSLPYGEYTEDKYIITTAKGDLLRYYLVKSIESHYYIDGVETTYQYLIDNGYVSKPKEKTAPSGSDYCRNIYVDNIIALA